jgi:hypothetical protein
LIHLTLLAISMAVPCAALGGIAGVVLAFFALGILGVFAERWVIRLSPVIWGQRSEIQLGLERSLRRIYESRPFGRFPTRPPRILLTVKVEPEIRVVRSWLSPGSILLSQGVLNLLSEEELRSILDEGLGRLRRPGIVLQTICSLLLVAVLRLSPSSRVRVEQLTPFAVLIDLTLRPLVVYLSYLGDQRAFSLLVSRGLER